MDPVVLFERAATNAVALAEQVRPADRGAPTPCTEWDVDALLEHMEGGDPQVVATCVETFIPQMAEIGRAAGFVGAEVPVPAGASAQDRLLGAMGRQP